MVPASQIRKGMVILFTGEPSLVLSHEIAKHGRAGAHNKCKIKGLKSGKIVEYDYYGNEKAEQVDVNSKSLQYIYHDDSRATFMDPVNFEQIEIALENIPNGKKYLKEGANYIGMFYEDEVISVQLPKKIGFEVVEAPDAVKGDTATNAQKDVLVDNGESFRVPLFIKKGDRILINTDEEEYAGKE
jgi:elongation factor P